MLLETLCALTLSVGSPQGDISGYQRDVDFVLQKIEQVHPAPYLFVTQDALHLEVKEIEATAAQHDVGCRVARLMKLVAELKDGHSYLDPINVPGLEEWFPLRFYAFPEGIYITSAAPELSSLVGKKVLKIGKLSAEEALRKVLAIQSANNPLAAQEGTTWLSNAAIASALGAATIGEMTLTVSGGGTETIVQTIKPFKAKLNDAWMQQGEMFGPRTRSDLQPYRTAFGGRGPLDFRKEDPALPPHLRYRLPYFMLEMPESGLLYFQWNFIQNWGDEDFPHFVARMFQKLDQHPDWRLAIDIRYNSGGNGELVANVIRQIIKRDRFDTPGNLFVIIGRKTFSAAVDFVGEAKHWTSAIFVGEPTGAGLNAYGDPETFETPNLHIPFQISTAYHQHEVSIDRAGKFKPDIPAVMHAAQYFAGSDPSLEAIREGTELLPIPVLVTQAGAQEAARALERRRRLWSALPWYVPFTEHDMNKSGYAALTAGKIGDAVAAFEMNSAQYPSSWNVWDSLGEAQRAAKQIKSARTSYEKSLVLYPGNKNARDAINDMEKNGH
jgi:hypothetical protein